MNRMAVLLLSFSCFLHVSMSHTGQYCDAELMRQQLANACRHLISHISKREVDLADYGYTIENVPNKHHSHRIHRGQHNQLNKFKLTHPEFPKGYYLLFHYPKTWRNNEIQEDPEPLDNEILTSDMIHTNSISRRSRQRLISGNLKYKRDAETDKLQIAECCYGACNHLFCN